MAGKAGTPSPKEPILGRYVLLSQSGRPAAHWPPCRREGSYLSSSNCSITRLGKNESDGSLEYYLSPHVGHQSRSFAATAALEYALGSERVNQESRLQARIRRRHLLLSRDHISRTKYAVQVWVAGTSFAGYSHKRAYTSDRRPAPISIRRRRSVSSDELGTNVSVRGLSGTTQHAWQRGLTEACRNW